jgi:SSS family solute:Na+ symporter
MVIAVALSVAASYLTFYFRDLMEFVQLIFSLLGAPFFAIFLIGIFTRRATSRGAVAGLLSGVTLAALHHGLVAIGWIAYGSLMSANFYVAVYAFVTSFTVGLLCSRQAERKSNAQLEGLVYMYGQTSKSMRPSVTWWVLASLLLAACATLNYLWR